VGSEPGRVIRLKHEGQGVPAAIQQGARKLQCRACSRQERAAASAGMARGALENCHAPCSDLGLNQTKHAAAGRCRQQLFSLRQVANLFGLGRGGSLKGARVGAVGRHAGVQAGAACRGSTHFVDAARKHGEASCRPVALQPAVARTGATRLLAWLALQGHLEGSPRPWHRTRP
jgi:hypothetical protein